MKIKHLIQLFIFFAASGIIEGQQFASLSGDLLTLDNGIVKRVIQVGADNHGIISKSYSLSKTNDEFLISRFRGFLF